MNIRTLLITRTEDPTQDSLVPTELKASDLLKRWRHKKSIIEAMWSRWEHEYLLLLRNFYESVPKMSSSVSIGQVVIVKDDNKPKVLWRMGRIESLNVGRDQVIRSCTLRMETATSCEGRYQFCIRWKLCENDVRDDENDCDKKRNQSNN